MPSWHKDIGSESTQAHEAETAGLHHVHKFLRSGNPNWTAWAVAPRQPVFLDLMPWGRPMKLALPVLLGVRRGKGKEKHQNAVSASVNAIWIAARDAKMFFDQTCFCLLLSLN